MLHFLFHPPSASAPLRVGMKFVACQCGINLWNGRGLLPSLPPLPSYSPLENSDWALLGGRRRRQRQVTSPKTQRGNSPARRTAPQSACPLDSLHSRIDLRSIYLGREVPFEIWGRLPIFARRPLLSRNHLKRPRNQAPRMHGWTVTSSPLAIV